MIKKVFDSKRFQAIVLLLSILLVILVIFQAGFMVGYKKGSFVNDWSIGYRENFISPARSFMGPFMYKGDGINPHGAVGEIVSNNLPTLIIKGSERAEEIVRVNSDTVIRSFRDVASTTDLAIGKEVVVIGEPNENGEINAKLIRIIPEKPFMSPKIRNYRNIK